MLPNTVARRPGRATRAAIWFMGIFVAGYVAVVVSFYNYGQILEAGGDNDSTGPWLGRGGTLLVYGLAMVAVPLAFACAVIGYARNPRGRLARVVLVLTVALPLVGVLYYFVGP